MYLQDCRFECGEKNFLDPFENCINLKTLYFHSCQYYGGIETLKISTPQLTDLSISNFRVDEKFNPDCKISFADQSLNILYILTLIYIVFLKKLIFPQ